MNKHKLLLGGGAALVVGLSVMGSGYLQGDGPYCTAQPAEEVNGQIISAQTPTRCFDSQEALDEYLINQGVEFPPGYPPG